MPDATMPALRIVKPANAAAALGLAVSHLMVKPAFANLKFGDWSRILVGQINRGHFCFAMDAENQIQGFMGWALASKEHAEGWVDGRRALTVYGEAELIEQDPRRVEVFAQILGRFGAPASPHDELARQLDGEGRVVARIHTTGAELHE